MRPSSSVSVRMEMRSMAGRSFVGGRTRKPESFQGVSFISDFASRRPFGYSGVSATHKRPAGSQSMFIGLLISGSAATS